MKAFLDILWTQVGIVFEDISKHFKEFPISGIFLTFLVLVFLLNVVKRVFIEMEKKYGTIDQSCEYLIIGKKGQDCKLLSYRKRFKENGNSCEGCRGKSFKMTDSEAENRIAKGVIWKHIIVLLANCGKNMLPYISFLYTLIIAIYKNNK